MATVLLFAAHEPTGIEVPALLEGFGAAVPAGADVTVLMAPRPPTTGTLMDDIAAARGLSYAAAGTDLRALRARSRAEARQHLSHVVACLRGAGWPARGELVSGGSPKAVLTEVDQRRPDVVVLLDGVHPVAHALRRDLGARLRRTRGTRVVAIRTRRVSA
jgi:hypothetical protein